MRTNENKIQSSIPDDQQECHPFQPILISLRILGLRLDNHQFPMGSFKSIVATIQLVIIVLFYHYWALSDTVWFIQNQITGIVLADNVTAWSAVFTVDILLLKRKDFIKLLEVVSEETNNFCDEDKNKFLKILKISCVLVWVFIFILIITYVVLSVQPHFSKELTLHTLYQRILPENLSSTSKLIIFNVDHTAETFFIQGSLTMIITLYILLCYNAKLWFKRIVDDYEIPKQKRKYFCKLSDVCEYRTTFEKLSRKVKLLDDVFSQIVAVWLLMILLNLCIRILAFLNPLSLIHRSPVRLFVGILSFGRAALTLIGITFAADFVQVEAIASIEKLDYMIRKNDMILNDCMYYEVQVAFSKCILIPTQLTAWKFAGLNRSFLMTCVGMMATYVIICIQLNPTAMEIIQGD